VPTRVSINLLPHQPIPPIRSGSSRTGSSYSVKPPQRWRRWLLLGYTSAAERAEGGSASRVFAYTLDRESIERSGRLLPSSCSTGSRCSPSSTAPAAVNDPSG